MVSRMVSPTSRSFQNEPATRRTARPHRRTVTRHPSMGEAHPPHRQGLHVPSQPPSGSPRYSLQRWAGSPRDASRRAPRVHPRRAGRPQPVGRLGDPRGEDPRLPSGQSLVRRPSRSFGSPRARLGPSAPAGPRTWKRTGAALRSAQVSSSSGRSRTSLLIAEPCLRYRPTAARMDRAAPPWA
jgi:hypothetical protein